MGAAGRFRIEGALFRGTGEPANRQPGAPKDSIGKGVQSHIPLQFTLGGGSGIEPNGANLLPHEFRIPQIRRCQDPSRTHDRNVQRFSRLGEDFKQQLNGRLFSLRSVSGIVLHRLQWIPWPDPDRNGGAAQIIGLGYGDQPGIARDVPPLRGRNEELVGHIEQHGLEIQLRQRQDSGQIELVIRILRRMIQIGDMNQGNRHNFSHCPSLHDRFRDGETKPSGIKSLAE